MKIFTLPTTSVAINFFLSQFHYSLGMTLYLMTKEKDEVDDDVLFSITDQIKHGIGNLVNENPELRIEFAKLYEVAGAKAVACSDHATSCSYLSSALSLLPLDHWNSHYELSLRFSISLAKSYYSCGDVVRSQCISQEVTRQCHSIEDKLPAYILLARSKFNCYLAVGVFSKLVFRSQMLVGQFLFLGKCFRKHISFATTFYHN
jgi:hypothetical protein